MRTSRTRIAALATLAAALTLGLTACDGTDGGSAKASNGGGAAAASPDNTDSKAGGGKTTGADQAGTADSSNGNGGNGSSGKNAPKPARSGAPQPGESAGTSGSTGSGGSAAGVPACQGAGMLVTAVHRFAGQQGDHLLLTASNADTKACWITSYPGVMLNDEGPVLPLSKKDVSGGNQRITLQPGQKVYSAVNLFAYGKNDKTATAFAIALRGANGALGPYYSVDSKGTKPTFAWTDADVLNWNTKKPYDF